MGLMASLRKGFGFFLNSMGVSTYAKKPKVAVVPAEVAKADAVKPD